MSTVLTVHPTRTQVTCMSEGAMKVFLISVVFMCPCHLFLGSSYLSLMYLPTVWPSHDCHRTFTCVTRLPHVCHLAVTCLSHGCHTSDACNPFLLGPEKVQQDTELYLLFSAGPINVHVHQWWRSHMHGECPLALSEPCPGTFYHLSIILLKHACSVVECIL